VRVKSAEVAARSRTAGNLFWPVRRPLAISWGAKEPREFETTEAMSSFPPTTRCILADPLFRSREARDYALAKGSPAIDTTQRHPAYDEFRRLYGLNIAVDFRGKPRPQGGAWDMGAFEHGE
jgi:hypothetical protein